MGGGGSGLNVPPGARVRGVPHVGRLPLWLRRSLPQLGGPERHAGRSLLPASARVGSGRVEGHVCIRDLVFLHLLPRARHRLWSSCPRLPYPITSEIWSPAGGFYADPKKWKRNTLITAA